MGYQKYYYITNMGEAFKITYKLFDRFVQEAKKNKSKDSLSKWGRLVKVPKERLDYTVTDATDEELDYILSIMKSDFCIEWDRLVETYGKNPNYHLDKLNNIGCNIPYIDAQKLEDEGWFTYRCKGLIDAIHSRNDFIYSGLRAKCFSVSNAIAGLRDYYVAIKKK